MSYSHPTDNRVPPATHQTNQPDYHAPLTNAQQAAAAFIANNADLLCPQLTAPPRHQAQLNQAPQLPLSHKRAQPSPKEEAGPNKKVRISTLPPSGPLPCCAVCLGRHPHRTVECAATLSWDKKHETFAERIRKALWTKDGKQICTAWQREEGCLVPKHDAKHICSGCGATQHGAQSCPHAQKAPSANSI